MKLSDNEIRTNILEVAKLMYDKGMANALEGNVSCRDNDRIYITPSGICKGRLKSEMIIVVDMSGKQIEGNYAPSSELKMHLECYRLRQDVRAVIHAHPPYTTAYAIANKPITTSAYPEMIVVFEKVPIAEYGTPSTDEIHAGFSGIINNYDVFLLANHGIISVSLDVFDAYFRLEAVESTAKVLTIVNQLGGEQPLPPVKIEQLYEISKKYKLERKARFK